MVVLRAARGFRTGYLAFSRGLNHETSRPRGTARGNLPPETQPGWGADGTELPASGGTSVVGVGGKVESAHSKAECSRC